VEEIEKMRYRKHKFKDLDEKQTNLILLHVFRDNTMEIDILQKIPSNKSTILSSSIGINIGGGGIDNSNTT
jgi:hypothetical protein